MIASILTTWGALQVLGRRAGSTAAERSVTMPGDALVPRPHLVTDHAITIGAPAELVWPWLTQMGWHRGGYYTPRWVDRFLFPGNWPSLDRLDPELVRDLRVGDVVPDGPPGTAAYLVAEVDAPRVLVLRSTTHVPPGWQEKYDATIVWTWSFLIQGESGGASRVHLRVRGRMSPRWFAALYLAAIPPADYVMAVGMLRGLKLRAESDRLPSPRRRHVETRPDGSVP
ncbi:MAG: SRPBCC family protein [Nocardioides sp.]